MKSPIFTEADLAARIVKRYESDSWIVYQEVSIAGRGRADIVAVKDGVVHVVEAKKALSFDVLRQSEAWLPFCSASFAACLFAKGSEGRQMAFRCARLLGLGVYEVRALWPVDEARINPVSTIVEVEDRSIRDARLVDALRPEHQEHAVAGTNDGGFWTDWKGMIRGLRAFAESHEGEPLRAALSVCEHHYASINSGVAALRKLSSQCLKLGLRIDVDAEGVARIYAVEIGGAA